MKVLIAGASGALGTPLTRALIAGGHEVLGVARSPERMDHLSHLGAHPILANVMDRDDLERAVSGVQADAVIHALTALKKTPLRHQDMYATNALRDVGTTNLLAAAREVGARRFVAESMTLGYGYGDWGEQVIDSRRSVRTCWKLFPTRTARGRVPLIGAADLGGDPSGLDRGDSAPLWILLWASISRPYPGEPAPPKPSSA